MAVEYSRESLVTLLAPAVDDTLGHRMVTRWAHALGLESERFGTEEALRVLEVISKQGGKVAAAASSARVQVMLRCGEIPSPSRPVRARSGTHR